MLLILFYYVGLPIFNKKWPWRWWDMEGYCWGST